VNEVIEGFKKGQKGSSAMPHKKNPISFENLTGIARVLRSHTLIAMENAILWHERDISHSSAERLFLPDNLGLLCYSLWRLDQSMSDITINKEAVEGKVSSSFIYLSSIYLHVLLASAAIKREDAYAIVQKASFEAHDGDSFRQLILDGAKSKGVVIDGLRSPAMDEIRQLYLGHTDEVFAKVGQEYPLK
jgi:adenylosuccinate lyase